MARAMEGRRSLAAQPRQQILGMDRLGENLEFVAWARAFSNRSPWRLAGKSRILTCGTKRESGSPRRFRSDRP